MSIILSFESSADETSVAVVKDGNKILSNEIATQIKSHQRFGGIVPEVASRHHIERVTILVDEALADANITYADIDAIAVTYGPGLVGSLLIGVTAAKTIAWAHNIPLVPISHLAGHIMAARFVKPIEYPALALLVSGGHTELVYLPREGAFEVLGETRDDAAGESYDKVGRVMGIAYPAGKTIDELAHQGKDTFNFPRAMENDGTYEFSFSGLKSAFINTYHNAQQRDEVLNKENLAASFQAAVVDVLVNKTAQALDHYPVKQLLLGGGVAANQGLRTALATLLANYDTEFIPVPLKLAGDNAAMIGAAGEIFYRNGRRGTYDLNADPSLEFEEY